MKATELRIGNYVKDPYDKEIKLVSVEKDTSMLTPIPLTEEWLLKFGFEKDEVKGYCFRPCGEYVIRIIVNGLSGSLEKDSSWFISIITGHGSQPVTIVRSYVHELQNLYFALTNKELILESES